MEGTLDARDVPTILASPAEIVSSSDLAGIWVTEGRDDPVQLLEGHVRAVSARLGLWPQVALPAVLPHPSLQTCDANIEPSSHGQK